MNNNYYATIKQKMLLIRKFWLSLKSAKQKKVIMKLSKISPWQNLCRHIQKYGGGTTQTHNTHKHT